MVGTTISIIIHSPVNHLHCSLALPHALFVLSSIFLAFFFFFFFFFLQKIKSQTMASYVKPLPYILFQFILVFNCVIYVVYMGYFVKNLGFYFVMNLLKIPDPIRLTRPTRPKKPDPNRPIPAGFSPFYYCHGLEIPIPDWHGSGGRTG
jgi:hypothetical protein